MDRLVFFSENIAILSKFNQASFLCTDNKFSFFFGFSCRNNFMIRVLGWDAQNQYVNVRTVIGIGLFGQTLYNKSRTSMTRTLMRRLLRLFRILSWVFRKNPTAADYYI